MKKYLIAVFAFIATLLLVVKTECVDRITIAFNGIEAYEKDDYISSLSSIYIPSVSIDMNTYTGETIVLYDDDCVKITIVDIVYLGDEYRIVFLCEGYGEFKEGAIPRLSDLSINCTNHENVRFEMLGEDALVESSKNYTYGMTAGQNQDISSIVLQLTFDNVYIEQFERK